MTQSNSLKDLAPEASKRIPKPANRWLSRLALPLGIVGVALFLLLAMSWTALAPRTTVRVETAVVRPVQSMVVESESIDEGAVIQAPGWVEPDPNPLFVSALTEGIVETVIPLEGERVRVGDTIAILVDEDARLLVQKAEARFEFAEANLEIARSSAKAAATERQELIEPTRRVALAKANLQQLEAMYSEFAAKIASAELERDQLQDELDRKAPLIEEGAVAEAVVVRMRMKVDASEAQIRSLEEQRRAADARVDAAQAELTAAERDFELLVHETLEIEKATGELLRAKADVEIAAAELDTARLKLLRCKVRSPVAGVVIERLSGPGSTINFGNGTHGAHLLHLYDPDNLQVRADVPLGVAARVGVGQAAEIVVDLLPDQVFRGEVTRFLHKADIQKNTVEAKVRIHDPSPLLKPEMLARVRLLPTRAEGTGRIEQTVQRVFIPTEALAGTENQPQVWVVDDLQAGRGTARLLPVTLGSSTESGWTELRDGILPGMKVIIDSEGLNQGDAVLIEGSEA
ncbi:MAG: efflux RND transporter periplasmic adaptor subunit [Planctomycetota bacterium]|nr:efflux RND transporter periplasmic adaptor subunit [Planctomycetota bacterium]